MKSIDVCLSPDLIHLYELPGKCVVVVDILRATSCITAGLASGVESIKPFASLEECMAMKEKGYVIAGERGGEKVAGFDLGNSPFSYMSPDLRGRKVAVTTTNGTQAIEKSVGASNVVIGSFLNLNSIAQYCREEDSDIVVLCAGWKGRVNMEDTLFAGALTSALKKFFSYQDDAVLAASALFQLHKNDLGEVVGKSSHAQRLQKFDVVKDIEFCLQQSIFDIVPVLHQDGHIRA